MAETPDVTTQDVTMDNEETGTDETIPETSQSLPEKEEQKRIIKELEDNEGSLSVKKNYYLITSKWFKQWKAYVKYEVWSHSQSDEPPPPIDNSPILEPNNPNNVVMRTVTESYHFFIVSEEIWQTLHGWYGGGPEIKRKAIKHGYNSVQVEVRPLTLRVFKSSAIDAEHCIVKQFSKATKVGDFLTAMCAEFMLEEDKCRVWDYHQGSRLKLLDNPSKRLDESQIIDNQKMLIEEQNEDGSFPKAPTRYRGGMGTSMYSYSRPTIPPKPPGKTGLVNLGNTCFMNSALQCLSNTTPLTNYFLTDKYKDDINVDNPLGMGGDIATAYQKLLKQLWSSESGVGEPRNFKWKIEKYAPQFSGYQQHDSQELLAFLLDGLHEDLNRVKDKPYVEVEESNGRPDEEVARQAWEGHKKRNDSIIVDWFQGQLKSRLMCPPEDHPDCGRVSITFDPFMYLTLPLPVPTQRIIEVIMNPIDGSKPKPYPVEIAKTGTIKDLKIALGKMCGINPQAMVMCDVYNNRFFKLLGDTDMVSGITIRDVTCAYEIRIPETDEEKANWDTVYVPVLFKKSLNNHYHDSLFGDPFILSVSSNITYRELYKVIIEKIQRHLKDDPPSELPGPRPKPAPKPEPIVEAEAPTPAQPIEDLGAGMSMETNGGDDIDYDAGSVGEAENTVTPMEVEPHETTHEEDQDSSSDEVNMGTYSSYYGRPPVPIPQPKHGAPFTIIPCDSQGTLRSTMGNFKNNDEPLMLQDRQTIAMRWTDETYLKYYERGEVATTTRGRLQQPVKRMDLTDCLDLFLKEEKLSKEDSWYCKDCQDHVQAHKQFSIWSLPRILVIHLKRFRYQRLSREKIETIVDFPTRGLDLTDYVSDPNHPPPIYDLFAVSNHFGGMGGGHYTAYAKHKKDGKFYCFDDRNVSPIEEDEVVTSAAYVLFYRRRDSIIPGEENVVTDTAETSPEDGDGDADAEAAETDPIDDDPADAETDPEDVDDTEATVSFVASAPTDMSVD